METTCTPNNTFHLHQAECAVDSGYTQKRFKATFPGMKQYKSLDKYRAASAECLLD